MRKRLRSAHTPEVLAQIYATPHDHRRWHDHNLRVAATIQVGRFLAGDGAGSAADLSCGNGSILKAMPAQRKVYGDFAPGYPVTGPIEETIEQLAPVNLFINCETLEHLDDPGAALKQIRAKTRMLLLSTPVGAWNDDNLEHYHAWDREGVEELLTEAGFEVVVYASVDFTPAGLPYEFGIWGAR